MAQNNSYINIIGVRSFRENRQVMRFAKIGKYNKLPGSTGSRARPRRNSKRVSMAQTMTKRQNLKYPFVIWIGYHLPK